MSESAESGTKVLPSGRVFDPGRLRSEGVLDEEELRYCREHRIPVGYDPRQIGWVPLASKDDLAGKDHELDRSGPGRLAAEARQRCAKDGIPLGDPRAFALVDQILERETAAPVNLAALERTRAALQEQLAARPAQKLAAAPDFAAHFSIRGWEPGDLDVYERILANRNLWTYMTEPYPDRFDRQLAEQLLEISRAGGHHEVRAALHEGKVVGQVRLVFDGSYPGLKVAEVSYWLAEEAWGKGLMSKILTAYTAQSFKAHGLDQIHAWIRPENVGSIRAATRAGYRRDEWKHEAALAAAVRRTGFLRYIAHRATYV